MTGPTPHRWFRCTFSLRTLFVAVTVLGCWLGYSLNWIREREEFVTSTMQLTFILNGIPQHATAPGGLWLLGERGREIIYLTDPNLNATAKRLFPEATIIDRNAPIEMGGITLPGSTP